MEQVWNGELYNIYIYIICGKEKIKRPHLKPNTFCRSKKLAAYTWLHSSKKNSLWRLETNKHLILENAAAKKYIESTILILLPGEAHIRRLIFRN